jgi:predicted nuclease of restriction endonuclease-like (RecB) superfamily
VERIGLVTDEGVDAAEEPRRSPVVCPRSRGPDLECDRAGPAGQHFVLRTTAVQPGPGQRQGRSRRPVQRDAPPDPRDFIRDPYILEFLGGQPQASWYEKDLEQGLLDQLQKFLLELGKGFAFVARQRHLRIEGEDAFVDLVFYNYIIKCFVLIELKVGKLSHQDVGQLDMYVRVFDEQMRQSGDNPTIGLILCSERNEAVARYSVLSDSAQIFASRYQPWLPTEAELQAELTRNRALLENAWEDLP